MTPGHAHVSPPGQKYFPPVNRSRQEGAQPGCAACKPDGGSRRRRSAPYDITLWAKISTADIGELWVNDRLVWASQAFQRKTDFIRLPLVAGDNRLLMDVTNRKGDCHFS